tara:strand:+ start:3748 stop:3903 length:156 start_codon:yes stop_codon:yes gene_type:complete
MSKPGKSKSRIRTKGFSKVSLYGIYAIFFYVQLAIYFVGFSWFVLSKIIFN